MVGGAHPTATDPAFHHLPDMSRERMAISFACEGCGKHFEVDEAHAGKRGKCSGCGRPMIVPHGRPASPAAAEPEVYGLIAAPEPEPSTFVSVLGRTSTRPSGSRGPGLKAGRGSEAPVGSGVVRPLAIGIGVVVLVLILVAMILPRGMMIAGGIIAGAGLIMTVYAYAIGAYIAFTEDFLYGFLYLVIPLYTAYYIISRWDDMRAHIVVGAVGLPLLLIGAAMMESGLGNAAVEEVGAASVASPQVELTTRLDASRSLV
jgi:hypothetical protein